MQSNILKHIDEPVSYDGITNNRDLPLFLFAEYRKEGQKYFEAPEETEIDLLLSE